MKCPTCGNVFDKKDKKHDNRCKPCWNKYKRFLSKKNKPKPVYGYD
jgi:hypothetical protein